MHSTSAEVAGRRSAAYWLLSRLFLEQPSRPLLQELSSALRVRRYERDAAELEALRTAVMGALSSARGVSDLEVEFTRLLGGIEVRGLAEPYESMAREGRMSGQAAEAVAAAYTEAGWHELAAESGPPDHLGAELRFLSLLCYREMNALAEGDHELARDCAERERRFLEEHVLCWVPDYCDQVAKSATHAFYLSVAALAAQACLQDGVELAGTGDDADD